MSLLVYSVLKWGDHLFGDESTQKPGESFSLKAEGRIQSIGFQSSEAEV